MIGTSFSKNKLFNLAGFRTEQDLRDPSEKTAIILIRPKSFEESKIIADHLKANNLVVINIADADPPVGKRIIDFARGVAYGLEDDILQVSENVYLIAN